jgi:hypothetical protein
MRLGRSKSRLVLEKNRPSSYAYAQWDIAMFSMRLPFADALDAFDVEAEAIIA